MSSKKGVVIEKGNGWALILLPDGEFKKINTNHFWQIGELYQEANLLPVKYVAAAVILLTILLGSIDYYSVKAYAHVSSLAELGVNRWGRVISVKAADGNGKQLLSQVEVKNDKLEVAVEKIYNQALKDKSSQVSPAKQVLSIKGTQQNQSKMEEKLLEKMNRGLQKAWQSQQKDNIKHPNKNKVKPQDNKSQNVLNQNEVLPATTVKKDIKANTIDEQIKDVDDPVDAVENKIKDHSDAIVPGNQHKEQKNNSNLEKDIVNEKNNSKKTDKHKNKD